MTSADLLEAGLGNAWDFDGSDDAVTQSSLTVTNESEGTVFMRLDPANDTGDVRGNWFYSKDESGAPDNSFQIFNNSDGSFYYRIHTSGTNHSISTTNSFPTGYFNMVGRWDSATDQQLELFFNTTSQGTASISTAPTVTEEPYIADGNAAGSLEGSNSEIDIAETRVLFSQVSNNWISTHYNNQSDNANFWTAGTWQMTGVEYRKKAIMLQ